MSDSGSIRTRTVILGTAALLVVVGVIFFLVSDSAQKAVSARAAEAVGNYAEKMMEENSIMEVIPVDVRQINDYIFQATGISNTVLISTQEGNVVFDTGLAIQAAKQKRMLEEAAPDQPVTHIILSHSHQDHAGGTPFWAEEGSEIVTHRQFPEEQRYLKQLQPYLYQRNRLLFPWMPESPPEVGFMAYGHVVPTILVDDYSSLVFEQGGVRFEVLPMPGAEGADNLTLWLPDEKIFFAGDFFGPYFPQFPNIFTMRGEKFRKPIEYIESLNRVLALEPEMVVPSHLNPVVGRERIREEVTRIRDAVQYVHDQVVKGMIEGKTVYQLMDEIHLPSELDLSQKHGKVSWAVRSIWEYYATWFHMESTTELYSVPRSAVYADLVDAAGADRLTQKAQEYIASGKPVHALHVLEVTLESQPNHRGALEARREALEILLARAKAETENSYELRWLNHRIELTNQQLGESGAQ